MEVAGRELHDDGHRDRGEGQPAGQRDALPQEGPGHERGRVVVVGRRIERHAHGQRGHHDPGPAPAPHEHSGHREADGELGGAHPEGRRRVVHAERAKGRRRRVLEPEAPRGDHRARLVEHERQPRRPRGRQRDDRPQPPPPARGRGGERGECQGPRLGGRGDGERRGGGRAPAAGDPRARERRRGQCDRVVDVRRTDADVGPDDRERDRPREGRHRGERAAGRRAPGRGRRLDRERHDHSQQGAERDHGRHGERLRRQRERRAGDDAERSELELGVAQEDVEPAAVGGGAGEDQARGVAEEVPRRRAVRVEGRPGRGQRHRGRAGDGRDAQRPQAQRGGRGSRHRGPPAGERRTAV